MDALQYLSDFNYGPEIACTFVISKVKRKGYIITEMICILFYKTKVNSFLTEDIK